MRVSTVIALIVVSIFGALVLLVTVAPLMSLHQEEEVVELIRPVHSSLPTPPVMSSSMSSPPPSAPSAAPSEFRVLLPWDRRSGLKLTNLPPSGDCGDGITLLYRSKEVERDAPSLIAQGSLHAVIFDSIGIMRKDEAIVNISLQGGTTTTPKVGLWNTENWKGRLREWSSKYRVRWLNRTDNPTWWRRFDAVASFETTSQVVIPYAANPLYARLETMRSGTPALPQLGAAMHVASNCHTDFGDTFRASYLGLPPPPAHLAGKMPKHRSEVVSLLTSAGIKVGNFGLCGEKGNDLSDHCRDGTKDLRKYCVMRRYTFYLALENSHYMDYVTEKLLEPLAVGVIPVYMGAPNVADYLPADHMIIDASQFDSVSRLASYLRCVLANKTVAEYYRSWRGRVAKDTEAFRRDDARRNSVPICRLASALRSSRRQGIPPPTPPASKSPPLTNQRPVHCST